MAWVTCSLSYLSHAPLHARIHSLSLTQLNASVSTHTNNNLSTNNNISINSNSNSNSNSNDEVKKEKKDVGWMKVPSLSVKEKKQIGSYAHSLGNKLKSQQIGKGGVTEAVAIAMVETLEKNELLKIKIHNNCPGEVDDAVKRLEELTGSVAVGQIGRTVILYRPSMTKLKAEEKKKYNQEVVRRRQENFKKSSERGLVPTESGRGRRGSSRYSSPS